MAGDWIKMRTSLLTNPKVNGIARELESHRDVTGVLSTGFNGVMSEIVTRNVMRHVTVSCLLVIWGAANEHTKDGVFRNADISDIDDMVGVPGFAAAMEDVGWLVADAEAGTVTLPNFNEYNTSGDTRSAGAKTNAQRQKEYRDRQKQSPDGNESNVTRDVTSNRREEKSREEKKEQKQMPPTASAPAALELVSDEMATVGKTPRRNGTRLPDDWKPSPELIAEVRAERGDVDLRTETAKFRDHFHAKTGKDATKLNWDATYRNWIRNSRTGGNGFSGQRHEPVRARQELRR